MKVYEVLFEYECVYEEVYVDENDDILTEAAIRQWKKQGNKMVKKYRCVAGQKKGRLVSNPGDCGTRKDPKKVRQGRKTMRAKKGIIKRKTKIAKRKSISKILTKMNARLMGKTT